MEEKEKAKELVERFYEKRVLDYQAAKQCALICVDEILKTDPMIIWGESDSGIDYKSNDDYWNEVRNEIEKL